MAVERLKDVKYRRLLHSYCDKVKRVQLEAVKCSDGFPLETYTVLSANVLRF